MKTSREDRILQILSQSPGITAAAIAWSLIGDYRFGWYGKLREFGKLYPSLVRLELEGRIAARWQGSEFPRKRVYFVVQRKAPPYVKEQMSVCHYPDCDCPISWQGEGPVPVTVCPGPNWAEKE